MAGLLVLVVPFVILGFVLLMAKVEEPLRRQASERDVEEFLDEANPDELTAFVREGTDTALQRFYARLGLRRRPRSRTRSEH